MTSLIAAFLVTGTHGYQQKPQQFLGARAVLSRMVTPLGGSALADPDILLSDDLNSFGSRVTTMPDKDAATQWLVLLHRNWDRAAANPNYPSGSQISRVLADLPNPNAWPLIAAQIKAEGNADSFQTLFLNLLFQILMGKNAAAQTTIARIEAKSTEPNGNVDLSQVKELIAKRLRDPDAFEAALKAEPPMQGRWGGPIRNVSGLVSFLGPQRAKVLLTYFLLNDKAELSFENYGTGVPNEDRVTADLAREVALAHVDELAYPQWTLASSPSAGNLFHRLTERFPRINYGFGRDQVMSRSTFEEAEIHCFINLFMAGKTAEAKAFGEKYADSLGLSPLRSGTGDPIADDLIQRGKLVAFLDFLADFAVGHPNSTIPMLYLSLAEGNVPPSQTERFLRRFLAGPKTRDNWEWFKGQFQAALLEQGKLAEVANMAGGPLARIPGTSGFYLGGLLDTLGTELHRPDLTKRAKILRHAAADHFEFTGVEGMLEAVKGGHGPAIEKHLIKDLNDAMARYKLESSQGVAREVLSLMRFYTLIGRYKDAVTLLDKIPCWDSPDIRWALFAGSERIEAAKALAKVGRRDEALRIIHFELSKPPEDEDAYKLLLAVDPLHAANTFSLLETQYPLDARPYAYLAELALQQGRLHEAEKLARKALDLNPADLHPWGRSTFHAQRILSAILKKLGRGAEAKQLDGYSSAADLMTRASDLSQMNLLGPAIRAYRQVIATTPELFQPRYGLGVCEIRQGLVDQGRRDIAAACERLPLSCGRVMRFPFDDVIISRVARKATRDALEALVQRGTQNPTVLATLGALYIGDGETDRAIHCYRTAAEIDPNCLMAWFGLSGLMDLMPLDLENQVQSNCIRLGIEGSIYPSGPVSDYAVCWRESAIAEGRRLEIPESVFTLAASRDALARSRSSAYLNMRVGHGSDLDIETPAARIAADPLIQAISFYLARG